MSHRVTAEYVGNLESICNGVESTGYRCNLLWFQRPFCVSRHVAINHVLSGSEVSASKTFCGTLHPCEDTLFSRTAGCQLWTHPANYCAF